MTFLVKLSTPWEAARSTHQDVVNIRCQLSEVDRLIVGLSLLREALVDALTISDLAARKLTVRMKEMQDDQVTIRRSKGGTEVSLSLVSLEAVTHFYLIYRRDGLADVDHLDLETDAGGYVTFYAADAKPPYSESVLRKQTKPHR